MRGSIVVSVLAVGIAGVNAIPCSYNYNPLSAITCRAHNCIWSNGSCSAPSAPAPPAGMCSSVTLGARIDCITNNEAGCISRGCCWGETSEANVPFCFYPRSEGYHVAHETRPSSTGPTELDLDIGRSHGPFANDVKSLKAYIVKESRDTLRVKIVDPQHARFEIPNIIHNDIHSDFAGETSYDVSYTFSPFGVAVSRKGESVALFNSTPADGDAPTFSGLIYSSQYIEVSTQLQDADPVLYGLGEHIGALKVDSSGPVGAILSMFSKDRWAQRQSFQPKRGGMNLYGQHPFYMYREKNGNYHGVLLFNSNAMDVLVQPKALTFRTIGGIVDMYIFLGPSPAAVMDQYTQLIGRPYLHPVWSLGYHMCRWGYNTLDGAKAIVEGMRQRGIPQDTQWMDIDYMDNFLDFTTDPVKFPEAEMKVFIEELEGHGQHFVNIHDPGISYALNPTNSTHYKARDDGLAMDIFVRDSTGNNLVGQVWPGLVYFPDFLNPNAMTYWYNQVKDFHDRVPISGMWIDMNEYSNFCTGECPPSVSTGVVAQVKSGVIEIIYHSKFAKTFAHYNIDQKGWTVAPGTPMVPAPVSPADIPAGSSWQYIKLTAKSIELAFTDGGNTWDNNQNSNYHFSLPGVYQVEEGVLSFLGNGDTPGQIDLRHPPYVPGEMADAGVDLWDKTTSLDAVAGGTFIYNSHPLNGFWELAYSTAALEKIRGKRALTISRTTFVGGGAHGGHWLGDNDSNWEDLAQSICGIIRMGLFGFPMVGADICGFSSNSNRELCIRWTQLGSMYPFARNHNSIGNIGQEPWAFGEDAAANAKQVLLVRYSLLPHHYTLHVEAALTGSPVFRALFFEFPKDSAAAALETQFMIGSALLVSPALFEGATTVKAYFSKGEVFYDFYSGKVMSTGSDGYAVLDAPLLGNLPLHIRGGHIITLQTPATTTTATRLNDYSLSVALAKDGSASGYLQIDDGESLDTLQSKKYLRTNFQVSQGSLTGAVDTNGYTGPGVATNKLSSIKVMGVTGGSGTVVLQVSINKSSPTTVPQSNLQWDATNRILIVTGLSIPINASFSVHWSFASSLVEIM